MTYPAFVTTSNAPTEKTRTEAEELAFRWGIPFIQRPNAPKDGEPCFIVERTRLVYRAGGRDLFFHPSMALPRVKRLISGDTDHLVNALAAVPGSSILDCTLGLASDAIVASYYVGENGRVVGIEGSRVLYEIVRFGLSNYVSGLQPLDDAMRRIKLVHGDYNEYLPGLSGKSFDTVYFDPMFRHPKAGAAIGAFRELAFPDAVPSAAIREAERIAKKRVVLKESRKSSEYQRLGIETLQGGRYSEFGFGIRDVD